MRISVLQPKIIRGDIDFNSEAIQRLIDKSRGEILVLPEYALTGSLIFDSTININEWILKSKKAKSKLKIMDGKKLLINSIIQINNKIYNACELLPTDIYQYKLFPDKPEIEAGINPGEKQNIFKLKDKKFKVIICTDLRYIEKIPTAGLDFLLFIFHFSDYNFDKAMNDVKKISFERNIPIIISSLVSDKNIGHSSYVNNNTVISLPSDEGILEIEIN